MTFTILVMFGSALFTDIIGVHAVFGVVFPLLWRVHIFNMR